MDGLGITNGPSLFFGRLPHRKQMAVYFVEKNVATIVAYVPKHHEAEVERLWPALRDGVMRAAGGEG